MRTNHGSQYEYALVPVNAFLGYAIATLFGDSLLILSSGLIIGGIVGYLTIRT